MSEMPAVKHAKHDAVTPRAKQPDASLRNRVSLRFATPADVPSLVSIINEAYLREAWLIPPPRITSDELHDVLRDPERRTVVAEIDDALVGSVRVSRHDGELYFGLLAVVPPWQRRGLASLLVAEAERLAREGGDPVLRLDCAKELGLPAFYQSLGYTIESETPDSYYGESKGPFTRVVLRKDLS